jgi:hypothetical protein
LSERGFASTWLPEQQLHKVGRKAHFDVLRGDIHRGEMWTDQDQQSGDLLLSPWQNLPEGDYVALLQVYHRTEDGRGAGAFLAETESATLGKSFVVTMPHDFGDWQRVAVSFRLDQPAKVRLRFQYNGEVPIWTGTLHLHRSGPRPIIIIGHNRNTPEAVDRSLDAGANAIEGDFSYRDGKLLIAETPPFPGWMDTSEPEAWLAHLQSRQKDWAFIYLDCKPNHVPNDDFYKYGQVLCELLNRAGVAPSRCVFGVGDPRYKALHQAIADSGFKASAIGFDGLNDGKAGADPESWPRTAFEHHIQCLGLGRASIDPTQLLSHWFAPIQAAVTARDSGKDWPKKVMFWTLEQKIGMRKVLDLGVDAIIAEHEERLCEVLLEDPYKKFCRRATADDWRPLTAHGIDA